MWSVGRGSLFCLWISNCSSKIWEKLSFLHWIISALLPKISYSFMCEFVCFYSTDLFIFVPEPHYLDYCNFQKAFDSKRMDHFWVVIFTPLTYARTPHSLDCYRFGVSFEIGKYESSNFFSPKVIWLFWISSISIQILGSLCQFLQRKKKNQLRFWYRLHWICWLIWGVLSL